MRIAPLPDLCPENIRPSRSNPTGTSSLKRMYEPSRLAGFEGETGEHALFSNVMRAAHRAERFTAQADTGEFWFCFLRNRGPGRLSEHVRPSLAKPVAFVTATPRLYNVFSHGTRHLCPQLFECTARREMVPHRPSTRWGKCPQLVGFARKLASQRAILLSNLDWHSGRIGAVLVPL